VDLLHLRGGAAVDPARAQVLMRQRKVAQVQAKRGSQVITLVHRQETCGCSASR